MHEQIRSNFNTLIFEKTVLKTLLVFHIDKDTAKKIILLIKN